MWGRGSGRWVRGLCREEVLGGGDGGVVCGEEVVVCEDGVMVCGDDVLVCGDEGTGRG